MHSERNNDITCCNCFWWLYKIPKYKRVSLYTEDMKNYIKRKDRCFLLHTSVPSCLPLMNDCKDPTSSLCLIGGIAYSINKDKSKHMNKIVLAWKVKMQHLYIWHLSLTAWPYNIDFDRSTSTYLCLNLKMTSGIFYYKHNIQRRKQR